MKVELSVTMEGIEENSLKQASSEQAREVSGRASKHSECDTLIFIPCVGDFTHVKLRCWVPIPQDTEH